MYSADSTVFIARDIDIANLSVRPSVRPSVHSSFISIKHLHEIPTGSPPAGALNIDVV